MNEGTNQPAPLVHNGVMFINNPGNIVQALDAKTGELIWENRIGDSATGNSQRGMAIYDDKVYVTTGDAHIYALDARTGKNVWDTVIGDRTNGNYSTSSGPIIAKGKVIQGLGGGSVRSVSRREVLHQRLRRADRQAGLEVLHHRQRRRAGRRLLGQAVRPVPRRRRDLDHRQLRSRSEPDLLGRRAGQALDARQPRSRATARPTYANSTVALDVDTGKLAWYFKHAPGESLDLDEVFERVLVDDGGQKLVFSAGKDGILWKLDRKTGKYLGPQGDRVPERLRFVSIRKTGEPHLPQRHRRATRSASGCRAARPPKAATTGTP